MKIYTVDLSFDPPIFGGHGITKENHDYVHMRLESSSKECLLYLFERIKANSVYEDCFIFYPIEEQELENEA